MAKLAGEVSKLVNGVELLSESGVDYMSHIWLYDAENIIPEMNGVIDVVESENHEKIHAQVWGEMAWEVPTRGYYDQKNGVLCVNGGQIHVKLLNRIIRKFDKMGLPVFKVHMRFYNE